MASADIGTSDASLTSSSSTMVSVSWMVKSSITESIARATPSPTFTDLLLRGTKFLLLGDDSSSSSTRWNKGEAESSAVEIFAGREEIDVEAAVDRAEDREDLVMVEEETEMEERVGLAAVVGGIDAE